MKHVFSLICCLVLSFAVKAQTISSNNTGGGNWDSPTTWMGGIIPDASNSSLIVIRPGDVVTIPAGDSVAVDQLSIQNGSTLNIAASAIMNVLNGSGVDLSIINNGPSDHGQLNIAGRMELSNNATTRETGTSPSSTTITSATTAVLNGGVYRHKYLNGGTVIGADWQTGSTIEFVGFQGSGVPTNISQSFYNFTWSCPNQNFTTNLNGSVTTINGNLVIDSNSKLYFFGNANGNTLNIGGNVRVKGNSSVTFSAGGTGNIVNIQGNLTDSSAMTMFFCQSGSTTVNLHGSFNITRTGSEVRFSSSGGSTTLNLYGNISLDGGTISAVSSVGNINFVGSTPQVTANVGNTSGGFNYTVASGAILDLGTDYLKGAGTFTLASGGTLRVGAYNGNGSDGNGALQNSSTQGNIRLPVGSRTYNDGGKIAYNGLGAQIIGNGQPTSKIITEISNVNGVSLITNTTFNGPLAFTNGALNVGMYTATINSTASQTSGYLSTTSSSNLVVGDNGASPGNLTMPFQSGATVSLKGFTLSRSAGATFTNDVVMAGTLTLDMGSLVFDNRTLTLQNTLSVNTGSLSSNSAATLNLTGSGSLGSALVFNAGGNHLNTLLINKGGTSNSVALGASTSLTIDNLFDLIRIANFNNNGTLTMSNGSTISRNSNALSFNGNRPIASLGGTYNVSYSGSGNITTTNELPLPTNTTDLGGLTIAMSSAARSVTMAQDVTANGNVDLQVGLLALNSHTFVMQGANWLMDGGGFNSTSELITFNGNTIIGGSAQPPTMASILVNSGATLSVPSDSVIVQGNFTINSGATFNNNNGKVLLTGSADQQLSANGSQFYDLTADKSTLMHGVTFSSNLGVIHIFRLRGNSVVTNNATLSMANGSQISRNWGTTFGGNHAVAASGTYNVLYTGSGSGTFSTGSELPSAANTTDLGNFTLSLSSGVKVLSLSDNVTANGNVDLQNGLLAVSPQTFTMKGANWLMDGGGFNSTSDLVTFSGNTTIGGTAHPPTMSAVTINGGATLTLPSDSTAFQGDIAISAGATLVHSNSKIVLTGASGLPGQNVSANGAEFYDLVINKINGAVTLTNPLVLRHVLTIRSATTLNSGGNLTLPSTADSPVDDASIASLPSGASVGGNVNVQRYFQTQDDVDRFISAPVSAGTVAQLQASLPAGSVPITGNFTGSSFPCTGCKNNAANMWYYDETRSVTFKKGYVPFPGSFGSSSSVLGPGVGYDVWMWNGVAPTTSTMTGPINQGPLCFTVTYTNNSDPATDGWNLVGNPYPSPIQWGNSGWTMSNIDPTVWVWDVVARVWHSYNKNTSMGDLTDGIIATGQAFWVIATASPATLCIDETAKYKGQVAHNYYRVAASGIPQIRISLTKDENGAVDNSFIGVRDEATDHFDAGLDALKLETGIEQLSLSMEEANEGRRLGQMVVGREFDGDIQLHVAAATAGEYSLSFEDRRDFPGYSEYFLVDTYLGSSVPLSSGYTFDLPEDQITGTDRFIVTRNPGAIISPEHTAYVRCYPNPSNGIVQIRVNSDKVSQIELVDGIGRDLENVRFETSEGQTKAQIDLQNRPKGLYIVKVVSGARVTMEKVLRKE